MIVATKQNLEKAVLLLKAHDELNAAYVLEDALNKFTFDSEHTEFRLEVVALPNLLECAIDECCTSFCARFREGSCPFGTEDKHKCYIIERWINE